MQGQRDGVDGGGDQVGAGPGGLERRRQRVPAGALAVDPDRQARHLTQLGDELGGTVRLHQRGGVVQEDPRRAELGQPAARLDERDMPPAAVEQPGVELAVGADDRLGGLLQVLDVVQRVVQAEDVDAALGGASDEPPREVAVHGREPTRKRPRTASASGVFVRPSARGCAPTGSRRPGVRRVEHAASRDLEVREACPVQDFGDLERSAVGMSPASGSCESTRIEVSTRRGTAWGLTAASRDPDRSGAAERGCERVQLRGQFVVLGGQRRNLPLGHPVRKEREPLLRQLEPGDQVALAMMEMSEPAGRVLLRLGHRTTR